MISIQAKIDKRGFNVLDRMKKQLPFIVARALTRTAKAVETAEKEEMQRAFDRPTKYIQGSLRTIPATKADLVARVTTKTPAGKGTDVERIFVPEIKGGTRHTTRYERALQSTGLMPSGMNAIASTSEKVDAFGNLPRSRWRFIINGLRKKTKKTSAIFALISQRGKLSPGIYERTDTGIKPIVVYVSSTVYKARFKFNEVAQSTINSKFDEIFDKSFDDAMKGP